MVNFEDLANELVNSKAPIANSLLYQLSYHLAWPMDLKLWCQTFFDAEQQSQIQKKTEVEIEHRKDFKKYNLSKALYKYVKGARAHFNTNSFTWTSLDGVRAGCKSLLIQCWGASTNEAAWCPPKVQNKLQIQKYLEFICKYFQLLVASTI